MSLRRAVHWYQFSGWSIWPVGPFKAGGYKEMWGDGRSGGVSANEYSCTQEPKYTMEI